VGSEMCIRDRVWAEPRQCRDTDSASGRVGSSNVTKDYAFKFRQRPLDGGTVLCGLLAHPSDHTISPQMYGAGFEELGLNYIYLAFDVLPENLEDAIRGYRALNIRGGNVTMPHKVESMKYVDKLDSLAEAVGAINVIINTEGFLEGYNADVQAFMHPLEDVDLCGKNVVLLGAGGGARACAFGLAAKDADITILNRNTEAAEDLAQRLHNYRGRRAQVLPLRPETLTDALENAELLVNATSIGFARQEGETPVPAALLRGDLTVYDIVFDPIETRLLRDAAAKGAKTINGLYMLVGQATFCFEKLTGEPAPFEVMFDACYKVLRARQGGSRH